MSRRAMVHGWANVQTLVIEALGAGQVRRLPAHAASSEDKAARTKSTTILRVMGGTEPRRVRQPQKKETTAKTRLARLATARLWHKIRSEEA